MQFTTTPNGASILLGNHECIISFFQEDMIRVQYIFDGEKDTRAMSVVIPKPIHTEVAIDQTKEEELTLAACGMRVHVQQEPFAITVLDKQGRVVHRDLAGKAYLKDRNLRRSHYFELMGFQDCYGLGERGGVLNKAGRRLRMDSYDAMGYNSETTDPLYKHIPFFIKRNREKQLSCGVFYDNAYSGAFDLGCERSNYWPHYAHFTCDGGCIDYYLILGETVERIVGRYTDLTGKTAMQPLATMGFMGSTMYYTEQAGPVDDAIVGFVKQMHRYGLGCDGFHLSSGYTAKEGKRYVFNWNRERFPQPADFAKKMAEQGALVSPNVKPAMLLSHPLYEVFEQAGAFLKDAATGRPHTEMFWGGLASLVDFTSPQARSLWKQHMKDALFANGIVAIWDDNCEFELTDGNPTCSNEGNPMDARAMRPMMSLIMAQTAIEAQQEFDSNRRPYILSRAGYAGIQRYAQTWAGDNRSDWHSLRYNIPLVLGMGLSGVANQGCDVGGFDGPAPDGELFVRWVQNGIFQPRFCIHSQNDDNTVTLPWVYDRYLEPIRDAFQLRYRLSLYLYSLLRVAHQTGAPIMRPLLYAFENDAKVADESFTFLFGDYLLVANVLEAGAQSKEVYLPKGKVWYDFWTHTRYEGGQSICVDAPLSRIPMFYPSGCILPLVDAALTMKPENFAKVDLLIECSDNTAITLYQDDGVSNAYCQGVYLETKVDMQQAKEQVNIRFTHTGTYPTQTEWYGLEIVGLTCAPEWIGVDEALLPVYLDRGGFETGVQGYWYDLSTRHVRIKLSNPKQDFALTIQKGRSIYGS